MEVEKGESKKEIRNVNKIGEQ